MIPISIIGGRGLIFDLDHVKILREEYHICGSLIGILPQIPQQNVFMGLPLQLMPEDIELLVNDLKVAYLVDDSEAHHEAITKFTRKDAKEVQNERKKVELEQFEKYKELMWEKRVAALELKRKKDEEKEKKRVDREKEKERSERIVDSMESDEISKEKEDEKKGDEESNNSQNENIQDSNDDVNSKNDSNKDIEIAKEKEIWLAKTFPNSQTPIGTNYITSTTTSPVISSLKTYKPQPADNSFFIPRPSRASYNLYKELHTRGYFITPGLRFGGQFVAYPGDPLRFHSHHIGIGFNWDQEFDVLDVVGGGRLGTSVKKCWVVGAEDPNNEVEKEKKYKIFSIEWAGFG